MRRPLPAALLVSLMLTGLACSELPPPPPVRDVRPTTLERGDTLIVELTTQPRVTGRLRPGQEVVVRLAGTLEPVTGPPREGGISFAGRAAGPGAAGYADRILATIDEPVERAAGGHARFKGRVEVVLDGGRGGIMRSQPLELDLFPRTLRMLGTQAAAAIERGRVETWLGATVAATPAGVTLTKVAPGGRAAQAYLNTGDVIASIDGARATIDTVAGTIQRSSDPSRLVVKKGGSDSTTTVTLPRENVPQPFWGWFVAALILWGVSLLIVLLAAVGGGFITVWERKVAGRMQSRIGPNRVGPQGWLQWLADALKLITKEDLVPSSADRPLFLTSPYLVFSGVFLTFLALPFSQLLIVADLNIGILYLLSVTSLVVVGIIMGGWASNSKWSLLGGMRSAAQIISYELPAGLAVMSVIVLTGTLQPQEIIRQQGGAPWDWYIFHNPFTFVAFFVYFVAALAEGNRTPFDLPEAESELVSGYNTEYSGFRFGAFATAEWVNLWVISALATTLFFGGWQVPGVTAAQLEASLWLQVLSFFVFFVKAATLVFVTIWLRWTLPRFRIDQMMSMCWKYLIPFAITCVILVTAWMLLLQGYPKAQRIASIAVFIVGGVGFVGYFLARVRYTFRATNGQFDLNLFR